MNKITLDFHEQREHLGELLNDLQYNGFRYEVSYEKNSRNHSLEIIITIKGITKQGKDNPRYVS